MYFFDSLDYNSLNKNKELEPMNDRLIQTFYSAFGGVFLGVMIAIFWSFYVSTQTNTTQIISIPPLSALCSFLFPNLTPYGFRAFWNFFR